MARKRKSPPKPSPKASGKRAARPRPAARDRASDFERAIAQAAGARRDARYVLRLYVTGSTPRSTRAIANVRALCERHLAGRYDLEVIDIYQQPVLAQEQQIIAAPTLVKAQPQPTRKLIGDLSDTDKVLLRLDIVPVSA